MLEMVLGILLAAISVALLVLQFIPQSVDKDFERKTGFRYTRKRTKATWLFSLFYPLIGLFLPAVSRLAATKTREKLQRLLVSAGLDEEINANELVSFQLSLVFLSPFIIKAFMPLSWAIPVGIILGLFYPILWVMDKKKTRQMEIVRDLPGKVDMLALSMEAGLDFNSAIKQIADQYSEGGGGPLIKELRVLMQNMRLGMSRNDALEEMGIRVDDAEIYSFVSVLVQADLLGASVVDTLKQQAKKIREERFMKAERLGVIASQKIMVPMMIFIFPLMFAVIFAPFLIKLFYGGSLLGN